jgi:hypothetical protein
MRQGSIWCRLEKKYRLQKFDLIYDFKKKAWCCLVIVLAKLSGDAPHWGDKTYQKNNFTLKFFYIQETTEKEAKIYS